MKKRLRKKRFLGPFSKTGRRPAYCANCAIFDIDRMECRTNGDAVDFWNTSCLFAVLLRRTAP